MVVVQAVLISGSETWVMTPRLDKYLEGFHHRVLRRMAGMVPKHQQGGIWVYTPSGAELAIVVLEEIGVYIFCCHNTVAQYIATHPIMDLCLAAEHNPVLYLSRRWWEQSAMYILGIRAGHAEAEGGGGVGGICIGILG